MDGLISNTDGLIERYVNMTLRKNRTGLPTEKRTGEYLLHY